MIIKKRKNEIVDYNKLNEYERIRVKLEVQKNSILSQIASILAILLVIAVCVIIFFLFKYIQAKAAVRQSFSFIIMNTKYPIFY